MIFISDHLRLNLVVKNNDERKKNERQYFNFAVLTLNKARHLKTPKIAMQTCEHYVDALLVIIKGRFSSVITVYNKIRQN